jgi:hypothetical protein
VPKTTDDLIPQKECAARLGVSLASMRRWRRLRVAPPWFDLNGNIYFRWPEVEKWLEGKKRG